VINKNVTIKLKSTTHVSGNTLLHVSITLFICHDRLSSNRLSLTSPLWLNTVPVWQCRVFAQYCLGDKIEMNEMGGACSAYGGEERRIQGFGGRNVRERDSLGDPGLDGRIILK
jgi:hypothetical protein